MKVVFRSLLRVLACILSAAAGGAHAFDALELPIEELAKIRIVSTPKFAADPDRIPSAISILDADDIRTFGWRTLADALRSLQGFNVTDDHTYAFAGARGISPPGDYRPRMLVLIDGVAISEGIYASTLIDSAFPIDMDLIERIEVIRGPSASVYGGDAMFGVINVVTRSGQALIGGEVGLTAGSGNRRQGRASWAGMLGGAHWLFSMTGFDAAGQTLTFFDVDASGNGQRLRGNGAEHGGRLFVQARDVDWRLTLIHTRRERMVPHGSYGTIPGDTGHTETDSFTALDINKDWRLSGQATLQQRLYVSAYGYDGRFPYDYSPIDERVINVDKARGNGWGFENRLTTTAWAGHRWTFGFEYQAYTRLNQLNHDVGYGCFDVSGAPCLDDRRRSQLLSLYAEDEMRLGAATTLTLGLRFDRNNRFGSFTSPRVGLAHDARDAGLFKLLYGTAFRTPSAYEVGYTAVTFPYGNPALDPEKMRSIEFAWEKRFDVGTRLNSTLYHFTVDGMILTDTAGLAVNGQEVRASGLEVEYERQWTNGVRLRAGLTVQNARNEFGRMDNSPRHMAKFNLRLPTGLPRVVAGLEGQWIGARLAKEGADKVRPYMLANLNLSYVAPGNAWDAGLGIYNLFDRRYVDPVAIDTSLPIVRGSLPQLGRTLQLRTRISF